MKNLNQTEEPASDGSGTKRGSVEPKKRNWITVGIVAVVLAFILIVALTW